MEQTERRFAVLIDADNVSPKYIKYILDEVSDFGVATYKRIYGDWTDTSKRGWKDALLEWSVNPIQQYSYTTGKNATDSAMIIDAMDILYSKTVEGYCLVTSDSDFTKLAQRLRESGIFVLGMGERKTPKPFIKACDTFKILEVIAQEDEDMEPMTPIEIEKKSGAKQTFVVEVEKAAALALEDKVDVTSIEEIEKAIFKLVTENNSQGKKTGMGEVGSVLAKKFSDFDVRNYGYAKLSTFLESLDSFGVIKSVNGYYVQEKKVKVTKEEVEALIISLIKNGNGRVDNLSVIYEELKRKYPGFDVKQYGFSRISSFIRSFATFQIQGNVVKLKKK